MKSIINKGMAAVKLPKGKVATVNGQPYIVEYEKNYVGVELFSHTGSTSLNLYADYQTGKFLKSELADLQAVHKALEEMLAFAEKQIN